MTDNQWFALSAACAVCVLISLIWAKNKPTIWRKAMYLAMCGYAITAMLFWLNRYTVPDLYPLEWFGAVTVFMLVGITASYYFDLTAPIVIPDEILEEMESHVDAAVRIARYQTEMLAQQTVVRQRGLRAAGAGAALIIIAYVVVHMYGLAETVNGKQEDISKVVFRIEARQNAMYAKVDTLVAAGGRREARIAALEQESRRKARQDSIYANRLLHNQEDIMSDQDRIKARLRPRPKAVPAPVKPIQPRRWWEFGSFRLPADLPHRKTSQNDTPPGDTPDSLYYARRGDARY